MSKIEDAVCELIQSRATKGLEKYGVTLERDDLTLRQWLDHAIEESLDRVLYLYRARMRLIADESSERGEAPAEDRIDWAAYPEMRFVVATGKGAVFGTNNPNPPFAESNGSWTQIFTQGFYQWRELPNAHIPGPWTESLRKRPEGV